MSYLLNNKYLFNDYYVARHKDIIINTRKKSLAHKELPFYWGQL